VIFEEVFSDFSSETKIDASILITLQILAQRNEY